MDRKKRILIIDNNEKTGETLSSIFRERGYETEAVKTGQEALDKVQRRFFHAALLDIMLPDLEGTRLLEKLHRMHPDMATIMVTACASLETAVQTLSKETHTYITTSLNTKEILATVSGALGKQQLIMENRRLYQKVQRELTERKRAEGEIKRYSDKLQELIANITRAINLTTELRDPYTSGHQQRVTQLACAIAEEMGLNKETIDEIRVAGSLHDIGKMYVPSEILAKPGRLNDIEFNMIKAHPRAGYDILKTIEFPWQVAPIVLQHHERINSSGYPSGLSDKDILLEAKILSVADVVEAMASHRPYRPALGINKALEEISQKKGDLYDPLVVNICLKLFAEKKFRFH